MSCSKIVVAMQVAMAGFSAAISYALDCLGSSNLTLKEEQLRSIRAVYLGRNVFV